MAAWGLPAQTGKPAPWGRVLGITEGGMQTLFRFVILSWVIAYSGASLASKRFSVGWESGFGKYAKERERVCLVQSSTRQNVHPKIRKGVWYDTAPFCGHLAFLDDQGWKEPPWSSPLCYPFLPDVLLWISMILNKFMF